MRGELSKATTGLKLTRARGIGPQIELRRKLALLPAVLCLWFCGAATAWAQTVDYAAELENIEHEIELVLSEQATTDDPPAIRFMKDYRLAVLLLSRDMLRQRTLVENERIEISIPASTPDEERANQIIVDIVEARAELNLAEEEAVGLGGLLASLALLRVETLKSSIALLSHHYYIAKYGLGVPPLPVTADPVADISVERDDEEITSEIPEMPSVMRFREEAYQRRTFEPIGDRRVGEWIVHYGASPIDDSLTVRAENIALGYMFAGTPFQTVNAACIEGETRFYIHADSYLMVDYRTDRLEVITRIDSQQAEHHSWAVSIGKEAAGIWGVDAIPWLERLSAGDRLYARVIERNGRQHSMNFDLEGLPEVLIDISEACGWLQQRLRPDAIEQIQRTLGRLGYYASAIDGRWGQATRNALQAYQTTENLAPTGSINRETLERLVCEFEPGQIADFNVSGLADVIGPFAEACGLEPVPADAQPALAAGGAPAAPTGPATWSSAFPPPPAVPRRDPAPVPPAPPTPVVDNTAPPPERPAAIDSVLQTLEQTTTASASGQGTGSDAGSGGRSGTGTAQSGARLAGASLTLSEEEALRAQLRQCWNVPAGAMDAQNLLVTVRVVMNPDRTVASADIVDNGQMSDSFYRTAAEAARRALFICQPLALPADKYQDWAQITFNFDPRDMF